MPATNQTEVSPVSMSPKRVIAAQAVAVVTLKPGDPF